MTTRATTRNGAAVHGNEVDVQSSGADTLERLSEAEARARYRGEWVVLHVTRNGSHGSGGQVASGRLVARSRDGDEAHAAARRYWREHPQAQLAVFYSGDAVAPADLEFVL